MEQVFSCELCTEEFNSREELNTHGSQHAALRKRPRKQHKCNLCRYEASQKSSLISHMRTHTGERPFKCTFDGCEMAFTQESTLKNHINGKHSDERPFKCNFTGCTHTAKTSKNLISHKKVHSTDKPFPCSECDYKTNRNTDLERHRMSQHSARRDFSCSHSGCDQQYASASALKAHKRNVHSTKSLVCPNSNCSYRTNRSTYLSSHMMVHNVCKEKISCSIEGCQYKGKNTLALEKHMRLHKTLLPCPVTGCGHYARITKGLEDHVKLHNLSDRPFQCPLCFKYYPTLPKLQEHCFSHTNEKPFACGLCEYAASFRSDVKRHISLVHKSNKFPFIVHLLDDRECLPCKVILPTSEFLLHCEDHTMPVD